MLQKHTIQLDIAHISVRPAICLPHLDFVDMDGATLLAEDIAQGVQLKQGQCSYPELIMGNGVHGLRTDLAIQGTTSA